VVEQLASAKATRTALRPERCRKVREECGAREAQLASSQEPLDTLAATQPERQRLLTIPGMGPITATALLAAVGDVGGG